MEGAEERRCNPPEVNFLLGSWDREALLWMLCLLRSNLDTPSPLRRKYRPPAIPLASCRSWVERERDSERDRKRALQHFHLAQYNTWIT